MGIEGFWRRLICISIIFALALSIAFIFNPDHVAAPIIPPLPPTTVEVLPGENFTLRHRMVWDEPGVLGYYLVALYWDYFGDNAWHFTLVSAIAYFDNDGDNLPDPGVALIDASVSTGDNGTRYTIGVSNAAGNDNLGTFNVDITLRAAGLDGTPHRPTDNHAIYYTAVWDGYGTPPPPPPPVTVRVLEAPPWTGTGVFGLENLYAVSLDADLWLGEGSKLVVKFYTYADSYQDESIVWSGTTPDNVSFSKTVPHPQGAVYPHAVAVEKAKLDLTTGNTENVISTIASFTVTRDILHNEIAKEYLWWPFASPPERDRLFAELADKYMQWPWAPS